MTKCEGLDLNVFQLKLMILTQEILKSFGFIS